ncbi:MAG: IS1595 family transposase [Gammaproteobacteria bacterium]|nr:IS1595 family transposase [Gammaproteobacteria bacterium]
MSRLRHKELWLPYSQCLQEGISVRKSAASCGISKSTSFRWRHRFLSGPTQDKATKMVGIVEADETFFTESCKGNQCLTHRKPRKRGRSSKRSKSERVPVLIVRDRSGTVADFVFSDIEKEEIHNALKPLMSNEVVLCSDGNSIYQTFAKAENIPHKRIIAIDKTFVVDKIFHIQNINSYISRLKSWMARFHGVATKYLTHYLG